MYKRPSLSYSQTIYRANGSNSSLGRCFGEPKSKLTELGGNPQTVLAEPVIRQFKIENTIDFIVIGSDGLYEKQGSKRISYQIFENAVKYLEEEKDFEEFLMDLPILLIKNAIQEDSLDSISVIIIVFASFHESFINKDVSKFTQAKRKLDFEFVENKELLYGEISDLSLKKETTKKIEKSVISEMKKKSFSIFCCCRKKKKVVYEQV